MRNAAEGRATISFSKLRHSLGALASTRAWDVSGRTPVCTRVRRPLRGAVATSLPPAAGERKWGTARRPTRTESTLPPLPTHSLQSGAGAAPGAGAAHFTPGHSQRDRGGPRSGPDGSQGVGVPRSECAACSRRRRHLNPILPPRLRPHLSVSSREAGSARWRALPVAALGNPVGPGQT